MRARLTSGAGLAYTRCVEESLPENTVSKKGDSLGVLSSVASLASDPITDPAEAARICLSIVGSHITAFSVGVKDPGEISHWEAGTHPKRAAHERRMLTLATVIRIVQTRHGDDVNRTRAWLLAPNPRLGGLAAVEWIRSENSASSVLKAAHAYVR